MAPARCLRSAFVAASTAAALGASCSAKTVGLDNLPCGNDACLHGYVCHPETVRCVPAINIGCDAVDDICATTTQTGDSCPSAGSFLPCSIDVQDCSLGCRTCAADLTWSECPAPACDNCTTYYRDDDQDGLGQSSDSSCLCAPQVPYTATIGGDCDDSTTTGSTCSSGCTLFYADTDGDGLGDPLVAVAACSMPSGFVSSSDDCNDLLPHCGASCVDNDSDGYCLGADCNDDNNLCTVDCSTCPPLSLTLTVTNVGAITAADTVSLQVSLGGYAQDATGEITCAATPQTIHGPFDFTQPFSLTAIGWKANQYDWESQPTAPFDKAACSTAGDYLRLRSSYFAALQRNQGFNARGWKDLVLYFRAAVQDGYGSGDNLVVHRCCGPCDPDVTILPADIGDTNACSLQQATLPYDDCGNMSIHLNWGNYGVTVGIDDLRIDASHIVPPVAGSGIGLYTTSFAARVAGSFDVTCTWRNDAMGSPLSDTASIAVSP